MQISGEISSAESALSSDPLARHLTLTSGSLWSVQSVDIQDVEQSSVLTNRLQALLWFTWVPSGEPWPGACHSCYVASSWNSLWCLRATLPHDGIFLWEQVHLLCFSVVLQRGQGKVESSSTWISLLLPLLTTFFWGGRWFLDLLFCKDIRPVWERLLLCSPGSVKSFFPLIWFLFSQT